MDSTSPNASRIAGQTSLDSGNFFKPIFAMAFITLVENTFVGRRCGLGLDSDLGLDPRRCRDREYHRRLAEGYGHAS